MKTLIGSLVFVSVCLLVTAGFSKETAMVKAGEELFKKNCSVCHPDGDNIVNPRKTLHKKDLDANGVKSSADIIKKMRNPGPGMTKFDETMIADREAKEIAAYIIKTFK